MLDLVNKSYTFPDGVTITIIQIKQRDDGYWVTYNTGKDNSVPRKQTMPYDEFMGHFSHLFK